MKSALLEIMKDDESIKANAEIYIIMLGTNDSKSYNWNTGDFKYELKDFVQTYIDLESEPTVYLATPPSVFEEGEESFGVYSLKRRNDCRRGGVHYEKENDSSFTHYHVIAFPAGNGSCQDTGDNGILEELYPSVRDNYDHSKIWPGFCEDILPEE